MSMIASTRWKTFYQRVKLSLLICLCSLLTACPFDDEDDRPFSDDAATTPVYLVLRSGESEMVDVQIVKGLNGNLDFSYRGAIYSGIDARIIGQCTPPNAHCNAYRISRDTDNHFEGALDLMQESNRFDESGFIPVTLFPDSPPVTAPIIDFSLSGEIEPDGVPNTIYPYDDDTYAMAVDSRGDVWFWGAYRQGNDLSPAMPIKLAGISNIRYIDAGHNYSLAVDNNQDVWIWSSHSLNQSRSKPFTQPDSPPFRIPGLSNVIAVAGANGNFTFYGLALRDDGTVWSISRSSSSESGELSANSITVNQVRGLDNIVAIDVGFDHRLALRDDGTVWAWGSNDFFQLGKTSSGFENLRPARVRNLDSVIAIAAGNGYSLALRSTGRVYGWGSDKFARIGGNGSQECGEVSRNNYQPHPCSSTPQLIGGIDFDNITDIAAGATFGVARRSDGSVWAWGDNRYGQLVGLPGLGSTVPLQVAGLSNVLAIRAGGYTAMAVQAQDACNVGLEIAGRIMAWGDNRRGNRGDGTGVNWLRPTPVLTLGDDATCAQPLGNRIFIYISGLGRGSVQSDAPGLTCTGNFCWQSVAPDSLVRLTATPAAGSSFSEWRWDCATSSSAVVLATDQVKYCKVIFNVGDPPSNPPPMSALQISVSGSGSVASSPSGIQCPGDCNETYNEGTQVTLQATPGPGFSFDQWQGDADCSDGMVTIGGTDAQCTAVFVTSTTPPPSALVTLTINIDGSAMTSVTSSDNGINCPGVCTAQYPINTVVTLAANNGPGETLSAWLGDCSTFGSQTGINLTMDSDKTCSAIFTSE